MSEATKRGDSAAMIALGVFVALFLTIGGAPWQGWAGTLLVALIVSRSLAKGIALGLVFLVLFLVLALSGGA